RLEGVVHQVRAQEQRQEQDVASVGALNTKQVTPEQAEAQVTQLNAEIAARAKALELLRNGSVGQVTGFSPRLAALARRPLEGFGIDHFALWGLTGSMSVEGAALEPDLVPRYLRALAAESALSGSRFDELVIERPPVEHGPESTEGQPASPVS